MADIEQSVVVTKPCYYLPPIHPVFSWLGLPEPATLIRNYCDSEGVDTPEIAHNTINKVASYRSTASKRSMEKLAGWYESNFPEQAGQIKASPLLNNGGAIGSGAFSWLANIPHFALYWGESFPYTVNIIEQLIEQEKTAVSEALDQEVSAIERRQLIINNPKVALLFEGFDFPCVIRDENDLVAGSDSRSGAILIANTLFYFLAAGDAEYSSTKNHALSKIGLIGSILGDSYRKGCFHLAYWKKLKQNAVYKKAIKDTWSDLALKLNKTGADDDDTARRTLNRYKSGKVEISEDSLMELLKNIYGKDAGNYFVLFRVRLPGLMIWQISGGLVLLLRSEILLD